MLTIAFIDWRRFIIPNELTGAGLALALVHAAVLEPNAMLVAVAIAVLRGAVLASVYPAHSIYLQAAARPRRHWARRRKIRWRGRRMARLVIYAHRGRDCGLRSAFGLPGAAIRLRAARQRDESVAIRSLFRASDLVLLVS